jgi:AraC-like DNA-binding protein
MNRRTFNGTRLRSREWVRYCSGREGVELLEAAFEQHVYERHIHDTYAVGITRRGVQRFWCRGATHDSLPANVIVIPPGEAHDGEAGAEGGYAYRMFYVSIGRMTELASDAFDRPASSLQLRHSCLLRDPALAHELNAAWKAMSAQPTSLTTDELFSRVFASLDVRHGQTVARRRSLDERGLQRVREYLREHVQEHVRLDDLATMASMSRFQLTRQFEKAYGLPLHAYHVHLRLSEAKRRLLVGIPIATVATDLGFADQSHLNRRFKGAFGMTPGEWRDSNGPASRPARDRRGCPTREACRRVRRSAPRSQA